MLSQADHELLSGVGPGTPGGEWLRRYWHPIAISDRWRGIRGALQLDEPVTFRGRTMTATEWGRSVGEFYGQPLGLRVLGEDLVLFRDGAGRLGLLDDRCPHRGASLALGRLREDGLECCYHGWKFDVAGQCLNMRGEPPDSTFGERVRTVSYPVQEMGGLIWAYLGPGTPPELPRYDVVAREDGIRAVETFGLWPVHWLQIVENSCDPVHTGILHGEDSERSARWNVVPEVRFETDGYGIHAFQIRGSNVRTSYIAPPTTILLAQPFPWDRFVWPRYAGIWRTPVDDTHTLLFQVAFVPEIGEHKPELPPDVPVNISHDVKRIFWQDYMAIVSQGALYDRTRERLGFSDRGVILLRRLVREGIRAVQAGQEPARPKVAPDERGILRYCGVMVEDNSMYPRELMPA